MKLANATMVELQDALPRAATLLNTSTDDLKVCNEWLMSRIHMKTIYSDRPVATYGTSKDLPFIINRRLHGHGDPGVGFILYECYKNPHLKYLAYHVRTSQDYIHSYIITKKSDFFKIALNCRRLSKLLGTEKPPILREGLLEQIIKSSIYFLLNSKLVEKYDVRIKRGILLDGPPGNGKTMTCRYIQKLCTEKNLRWGVVTASDIDKAYCENTLDELFSRYAVTFFDDIDISYLSRKGGSGKIACSILSAMDGMNESNHTVRFFTTNEAIKDMDPAFVRPGRIDHRFIFNKPEANLRKELILSWSDEIVTNIDLIKIVDKTEGNSFAELEAIKSNLVTNFLFGDQTWNLDKALEEFRKGAGSFKESLEVSVGFGSTPNSLSKNEAAATYDNPSK
jgi:hypothetical protein